MMNGEIVMDAAVDAATRVSEQSGWDDSPFAKQAYQLLFARKPTSEESTLAAGYLADQRKLFERANAAPDEARRKAAESLVHMLLSSNEFLFVD